jgi:hypothetical protein
MAWEIVPRSNNETSIVNQVIATSRDGLAFFILFLLSQVFKWINENFEFITTIFAIAILCTMICYYLNKHSSRPKLNIFITIMISLGLIICVIYFDQKIRAGVSVKATTIYVYNYTGLSILFIFFVKFINTLIKILSGKPGIDFNNAEKYAEKISNDNNKTVPNSLDNCYKSPERIKYPQSKNIKAKCSLDEDVFQWLKREIDKDDIYSFYVNNYLRTIMERVPDK